MTLFGGRRVHFIGIGGAGMSAIAKVVIERGVPVSGSDMKRSRAAVLLEAIGAEVRIGHEAAAVDGAGVVVVSSAIPDTNPELERARALGLQVLARGEALAQILSSSRAVVVAGTHGKTTTTSMIVAALTASGLDPTYLVGGGLNDVGTNARHGRGGYAVAESDESDGSFLLLEPHVAVITNVEVDHVDYWTSLDDLLGAFRRFLDRVRPGGAAIVPYEDQRLVEMAQASGRDVLTFGEGGDVRAEDISLHATEATFVLVAGGERARVRLRVPGRHNVMNALAAAAAAQAAGVGVTAIASGLETYLGVERRFQIRGTARDVTVIDDYAHHPTEVEATLAAARPGGWRRVVAVFQPHRYSRTQAFAPAFGAAFSEADRVVVTDVYGAGEAPVPGVSGKLVADAVCRRFPGRPVAYLPHREELLDYLIRASRPGDAVLTMGAGDVGMIGDELLARLEAQ
ncbi:MAG TPA: UDP-N-acetylmuramate--L-alanine ligase [Actinomycetota bacterium]|jgi:UDP-N-acetylmuramate--alanine ligase|nr:UDP-N-acetylmuramate--L-alanine ligase [Actinomycetota bacterium]